MFSSVYLQGAIGLPGVRGSEGFPGFPGPEGPMGRAGAKGDRGDSGVEGMKGNRVSSGEFLPISRGRISASFPIENNHLFSQYHGRF